MTRKHSKTEFVGIRMSLVDVAALRSEAGQCGMTMPELVRRPLAGQLVTSRTDQETTSSIDRLGRTLKYLYLKDKGCLTFPGASRQTTVVVRCSRGVRAVE